MRTILFQLVNKEFERTQKIYSMRPSTQPYFTALDFVPTWVTTKLSSFSINWMPIFFPSKKPTFLFVIIDFFQVTNVKCKVIMAKLGVCFEKRVRKALLILARPRRCPHWTPRVLGKWAMSQVSIRAGARGYMRIRLYEARLTHSGNIQ